MTPGGPLRQADELLRALDDALRLEQERMAARYAAEARATWTGLDAPRAGARGCAIERPHSH